jgi:putative addiction module antidote
MGENPKIQIEDAVLEVRAMGESLGVVLPRQLAERLNLKSGDRLNAVMQADGSVAFTPVQDARSRTQAAAQRVISEYAETFRILSK